jgi:hypothetical protein
MRRTRSACRLKLLLLLAGASAMVFAGVLRLPAAEVCPPPAVPGADPCPCGGGDWKCDEWVEECYQIANAEDKHSDTLPFEYTSPSGGGAPRCSGGNCCCFICDPPGSNNCGNLLLPPNMGISHPDGGGQTSVYHELPLENQGQCESRNTLPFDTVCTYYTYGWQTTHCMKGHWDCPPCAPPTTNTTATP